jgi:hypothetical protein
MDQDHLRLFSAAGQFLFRFLFLFELTGWIYAKKGPNTRFGRSAEKNGGVACGAALLHGLSLEQHFAFRVLAAPVESAPTAHSRDQLPTAALSGAGNPR